MIDRFGDKRDWFFDKRFGLFVHWGLYAIPAWHEQQQWRGRVPRAEYVKLIDRFNPTEFDPDSWIDLAQAAGMEYMCFTTKHHEGFCMWDTATTDFNVMNSPFGRDILAELASACNRRDFPLCLYYSVVDWHHPSYPNQGRHHELAAPEPGDVPDLPKYIEYLKAQVRELCTNYGKIHGFWWDMNVAETVDPSINSMIHELQPAAIINNRGFDDGDFGTPERDWEASVDEELAFDKPTEACQSVGTQSWGYRIDEDYYTDRHLIASVAKILAKGGNYLLNIGPKADGTIPAQSDRILRNIGKWYDIAGETLTASEPASHLSDNRDVVLTRQGNTLYVHLLETPICSSVILKPLNVLPKSAVLMNDGSELPTSVDMLPMQHYEGEGYLRIYDLPANEMADTVMVLQLEFDDASVLDSFSMAQSQSGSPANE